jgi:hypothetical protein
MFRPEMKELEKFVYFIPASALIPTIHRLEHNWHYTYIVGFFKYWMLPEDG